MSCSGMSNAAEESSAGKIDLQKYVTHFNHKRLPDDTIKV